MPQSDNKKRLRDVLTEASDGKQADQSEMNTIVMGKMMKVLPFFMFFIMISVPGALALYYSVSNMVAVVQQHHLLKKDEIEMDQIADLNTPNTAPHKKATAKAREKVARPATVTRIVAKDTRKKGGK